MEFKKKLIPIFAAVILAIMAFSFGASEVENMENSQSVEVQETQHISPTYAISSPEIPEGQTFAGEKIPFDKVGVREKMDRELLVNTYWQSSTVLLIKRSRRIFDIIEPILREEGVPADFKYLAVAESGLLENAVSSSGARGIWQFMKSTGKKYGLESTSTVEERYNTEKATRAACKYLKRAYKETGSWALAAAAYNRGLGGIKSDMRKQKANSYYDLYLNRETGRYVYRIIALKTILSNPSKFGFNVAESEYYTHPTTYNVTVDTGIADLPQFALSMGTNYSVLRVLNPWLISYSLENKSRKKYIIRVPELQAEGVEE